MFIPVNPDKDNKLTKVLVISYTLLNMVNTGLYGKAIERWNNLPKSDRNKWVYYREFFIAKYQSMLREGKDPTNSQEGYGRMFNAMEGYDGESIVESITQYA